MKNKLRISILFITLLFSVICLNIDLNAVQAVTKIDELKNETQVSTNLVLELEEDSLKNRLNNILKGTYNNITWNITNGTLTISGTGEMEDYTQSSLSDWYSQSSEITKIVIKNGVTSIGSLAFYNCTNVTSVTIPSSVKEIGEMAFFDCISLSSITIPKNVTKIEKGVFANCINLTEIKTDGVTSIGEYAFQCTAFTEFTVNKNITSIAENAFWDTDITSFYVQSGNTVFSSKDGVLYKDSGRTLFAYPQGNVRTSFNIASNVNKIGKYAFTRSKKLDTIIIPNTVKSIEESAFQQCRYLKSITIPNSVTSVGNFTFYECSSLTSVTFGTGLKSTSYQMFRGCYNLSSINFESGLQELYAQTFVACTSLTNISLPSNIKYLGNACFGNCINLKSFSSKGINEIPYQAFWACENLESVMLNEGIKKIQMCAFYYCKNLKNIKIPNSTTYIHSLAFPKITNIICKNNKMQKFGQNGYRYLQNINITGTRKYNYAYEVLNIVNQERKKQGLNLLKMDESLLESAMVRAAETAICFSHTRPDGSICFDLNSKMMAENIAAGQKSATVVMNEWMNSSGHKANILKEDLSTIGIGCFLHNGIYYWVQCFGNGKNKSDYPRPKDSSKTQVISLATEKFDEATTITGNSFSNGENKEYSYVFSIVLNKSKINCGNSTNAKLYLSNPGFSGAKAIINNSSIKWSSSSTKIAKINNSGKITGTGEGSATITAKLDYFNPTSKIIINKGAQSFSYSKTVNKSYGDKSFNVNAKLKIGDGKLSYSSSNKKVATINSKGKITIKNTGTCIITVRAKGTSNYKEKEIEITLNVKPKKANLKSVKADKGKKMTVKWNKDSKATGYQIYYSTSKKFTSKTTKKVTISKNKTKSTTIKKLKKGKKYYIKIRSYKTTKVNGKTKKIYGSWSKIKNITAKK